ncbi:ATP-binding cassette domain-containing protein [Actinoplanes sp. NPDC051343]|uniref:ATP-binding cassette domain-containing protein n=1 Tax=Actinoplanes sp. NPDC051343 TaxID=3363906 RepID=UPI0037A2D80A
MTVADNLLLGPYRKEARREHKATLASVHEMFPRLAERSGQPAGNLSGGEQQMPAIGRAPMARPALLLLDEPSPAVVPVRVDEVLRRSSGSRHRRQRPRGRAGRRAGLTAIRSAGGCGTAAVQAGRIGGGICGPVKAIRSDRGGFGVTLSAVPELRLFTAFEARYPDVVRPPSGRRRPRNFGLAVGSASSRTGKLIADPAGTRPWSWCRSWPGRPLRMRDRCAPCARYVPTGSPERCPRCMAAAPPALTPAGRPPAGRIAGRRARFAARGVAGGPSGAVLPRKPERPWPPETVARGSPAGNLGVDRVPSRTRTPLDPLGRLRPMVTRPMSVINCRWTASRD